MTKRKMPSGHQIGHMSDRPGWYGDARCRLFAAEGLAEGRGSFGDEKVEARHATAGRLVLAPKVDGRLGRTLGRRAGEVLVGRTQSGVVRVGAACRPRSLGMRRGAATWRRRRERPEHRWPRLPAPR
jgi:hypothetical protein